MTKVKVTPSQQKLLEAIAEAIVAKRLAYVTIFFLESGKPLNYIGSQLMAFLEPFATWLVNRQNYNDLIAVLEQREGIDYFLNILEDFEYKDEVKQKEKKALMKSLNEQVAKPKRNWKDFLMRKNTTDDDNK